MESTSVRERTWYKIQISQKLPPRFCEPAVALSSCTLRWVYLIFGWMNDDELRTFWVRSNFLGSIDIGWTVQVWCIGG